MLLRHLLTTALLMALAGSLAWGCGDDGDGAPAPTETAASATVRTFLAVPPDGTNEVVVITLLDDGTLAAYICDGRGTGEFFEGPVEGGSVSLESERGALFTAQVSDESISGDYTLGADEQVSFTARPEPEAGIFLLTFSEDGAIEAEAIGGGTLAGELTSARFTLSGLYPSGDALSIDARVVEGGEGTTEAELVEAGGQPSAQGEQAVYAVQATGPVTTPGEFAGTQRVAPADVVTELADASVRFNIARGVLLGRSLTKATPLSWGTSWVDPEIDP